MWLWSRPWPYAWLWGSGSDFQKTASVLAGVSASVSAFVVVDNALVTKAVNASYNVSASTDDFDEVALAFESAPIYYVSGSASYALQASINEYQVNWSPILVTAQIVWAISQAGEFSKSGSTTAQLSASASVYELLAESSTSVTAQLSAPITDVTVSIFYGYSTSVVANITASVDAALYVVEGQLYKTLSDTYYLSAPVSITSLRLNSSQRGKLVWKKKRGYVYVATSTA